MKMIFQLKISKRLDDLLELKNFFIGRNNDFLNDHPKFFNLSNIKFLLNIHLNTPDTKHIKQILVILIKSQLEIRSEI